MEKSFILGMPTVLPTNLSKEQEQAYILQLQIEEVSRKLRTGDLGIPVNPEERSPSPEPIYSSDGKRLNTREFRTRKALEEERHTLIQKMLKINPEFKPPADYKPPIVRVSDKVMIPQEEHPDINFVGLLIGPRGNTLKSMERETGAKIIIRGKGSVKEGKVGRKDGHPLPGEDEPLHAYVTANNPEFVKKAVDKIKEIIRQGVEVPEGQNDLRRMQLRELALLNGTLRENDGPRCSNCGAADHKSWLCPDKPNVTHSIVCSTCGGAGHIAKDCRAKRLGGAPAVVNNKEKAKIDEEYMSLMAELGEGPPPDKAMSQNNLQKKMTTATTGVFDKSMVPRALTAPPPTSLPPPWSKPPDPNTAMPPGTAAPPTLPPWQVPPPPWTAMPPPGGAPPPWTQAAPPPPPPPPVFWGWQPPTVPPPPGMPPGPGMPGMQPGVPGMQPGVPGMQPAVPGMQPAIPGMQPGVPGMQPAVPGMQPAVPGMQPAVPGMQPAVPGMQPAVPGMQPAPPGMQSSPQQQHPGPPGMPPTTSNIQTTMTGMMQQPSVPGLPTTAPSVMQPPVPSGMQSPQNMQNPPAPGVAPPPNIPPPGMLPPSVTSVPPPPPDMSSLLTPPPPPPPALDVDLIC
ncbi:splicing factor 1 isoform X2 [Halyomorpha halys]